MAVALRMSSAVRLYIVHSAKEKRGSSQYIHLFTVFTVRILHERNKQPCDALFKSGIWQCLKPASIVCRLVQTIQLLVRTAFFPCWTPPNKIESWQNSKHMLVKLSRKGSRNSLHPLPLPQSTACTWWFEQYFWNCIKSKGAVSVGVPGQFNSRQLRCKCGKPGLGWAWSQTIPGQVLCLGWFGCEHISGLGCSSRTVGLRPSSSDT